MSAPAAGPRKATIVTALGLSQTLAWASSYYLPAILARPMAEELGLSTSAVYACFSGALLITALLGPWTGRVIDRRGGRDMLAASNLVFIAGLLGLAFAQGPWSLAAAWALLGIGMAMGLYDSAFATLAGLYGALAKGPITGVTLFAGFASTIGWPLSAWMGAEWGWRGACLGWALAHLLIGLPLNLLLPKAPPPAPKSAADGPVAPAPRHAMLVLAFFFAATTVVSGAVGAHQPALLAAAGASPELALLAASLTGPAQVAARILQFSMPPALHPVWMARFACLIQAIGGVLLVLLGAPAAIAFALLHGGGNGLHTIAKGTLPLAVFGPVGYGQRQGILAAPGRLLQAGAPLGFGLLMEYWGAGALWVTSGLCLAALLSLMLLPSRKSSGGAAP
ncbi:MFS transporter [Pseudoroseomonas cervicalis]|uniref:MFS transporter n=1 Tax=Teichococcus cervicalis TaxID=204525 RepID=UPI0022F1CD5A|nr:MFS transporter [Pseudoroseomonas cervicalis]WBV44354.1 MFS transporter [Pseudoroseomonas cervicalis]